MARNKTSSGMTVREAGRRGGEVTAQRHGQEFYEEIGRIGGQKVKRLIEEGKKAIAQEKGSENASP